MSLLSRLYDVSCNNRECSNPRATLTETFTSLNHFCCDVSIPTPQTGSFYRVFDDPNAYGTSVGDYFGYSAAICETYSIVGAVYEDDADGASSGKAYIFNNATGALLHTLDNPNPYGTSEDDYFGLSVAICETYSIVGASSEDDADGAGSGKAYIFDNATGALLHTLDNPNPFGTGNIDYFGRALSICETYSIVSAPNEGETSMQEGKAYIFDNATGALLHTLDNPNPVGTPLNENFGRALSICETYSIVGCSEEDDIVDDDASNDSGKAYIFDNATGALLHTLDNPNVNSTSYRDYFGSAVAINETYSVVSASGEYRGGILTNGVVYIFDTATGTLLHVLNNPNPAHVDVSDQFGGSIAVNETHTIVGAFMEFVNDDYRGRAYIFDNATGILVASLSNLDVSGVSTNSGGFGTVVAMSETYSLVCAPYELDAGGAAAGKVYIFK